MRQAYARVFEGSPAVWARAPGRVDLMGSHTDYNEGHVLTMPIDRDTWVAAAPSGSGVARVVAMDLGEEGAFEVNDPHYDSMRGWLRYVAGVCSALRDWGHRVDGFHAAIQSTVPMGGGLSSSAALEASVAVAVVEMAGISVTPVDLAQICRRAENEYAGMNCGILDQYTSILGEEGTLILLDCRALAHRPVSLPGDLCVVVCDTHAPHELTGSEYGTRRGQCEAGVRALRAKYGEISALRDASIAQLQACRGEMTEVVERRCRFVIEENLRVLDMAEALERGDRERMSILNAQSYAGARDLYEISVPAMEAMVEAMLASPGVVGARQAGAGFGGCMTALVDAEFVEEFTDVMPRRYEAATGLHPEVHLVRAAPGAGLCTPAPQA